MNEVERVLDDLEQAHREGDAYNMARTYFAPLIAVARAAEGLQSAATDMHRHEASLHLSGALASLADVKEQPDEQ